MSNLIPADKLISEIERLAKSYQDPIFVTIRGNTANNFRDNLLSFITSLQQERPDQVECVWIHKKYNREYRIVSDNARLKNSNGEWIDCVIYAPLYENEFEMFAREKDSFYKEFEKK